MSSKDRETRTRILDAALHLLIERGGKGVRMGDIAKQTGISRQAVYLHFASRADLLEATTRYLDEESDIDGRLAASRAAKTGEERLEAYIAAWSDYLPVIYPAAKALLLAKGSDEAAAAAWADRMAAMRDGCRAAIEALAADGRLSSEWPVRRAIDALWALLSVETWEQLTVTCGWTGEEYRRWMHLLARRTFVLGAEPESARREHASFD